MKYAIIRQVQFKTAGPKSRLVWANVLVEHQGLALVLVPKPHTQQPHSIYIATENITERVFEAVGEHRFDLDTNSLIEAGDKLRMLGKKFDETEFFNFMRRKHRDDEF